jgi:glutamate carboxypeptidase
MGHRPALAVLLCCLATGAFALDSTQTRITRAVEARQPEALELLAETVNVESATENHAGVRRVGEIYAREFAAIGFETSWVELPAEVGRAGHLVAVHRGDRGRRLLLIGHLDTVLQGEPFRSEGNRAYGTGSSDMKGGNLVILEALRALHATGELEGRQVTVVFTGDEEDPGLPIELSREALLAAGEHSDVALGFEGGSPGLAVIGRRGIGSWRLEVTGRQAHSSGIFGEDQGYGAIFEAARILDRFRQELPEPYLTFNPSMIVGGTTVSYDDVSKGGSALGKTNVIPREVHVIGDLRFLSSEQFDSARRKMTEIVAANLPGTTASISFVKEYPAMAPTDANRAVLAVLDEVSRDLGAGPVIAQDPAERGAGDISFVCGGERLACLDGLGAMGGNDHAPGEYVEIDTLPLQTRRAALLFYRLTR